MNDRASVWAAPAGAQTRGPFGRLSTPMRVVGVPAMAAVWWALAFLAWKRASVATLSGIWPPTLPALVTDLGVAVVGPIGASLLVAAVLRRPGPAFLSVLIGFVFSAGVTLTRGADAAGSLSSTVQRYIMLAVCAVAALVGLGIGLAATRSLRHFGFLGLLAVTPVVSLAAVLLLDSRADHSWLTRSALVALLVMIAWSRWSDVLFWPIFFILFWLLNLAMAALEYGASSLRHVGLDSGAVGTVAEAMLLLVRSAWRVMLGLSWQIFWPAAVIAALVIAGQWVWRRVLRGDT